MADGTLGPPPPREASPAGAAAPARVLDARQLLAIARRRAREIALVAAAVMLICVAALVVLKPRYTATTLLLVDPSQQALLTPGEPGSPERPGMDSVRVDSEVEIARSQATLLAVIDRLELVADPEFGARPTLLDKLRAAAGLAAASPPPGREVLSATLRRLADAVGVRRRGLTRVLEISATSGSPERAARVANALAQAYLDGQIAARTRVVETARDMLRAQVARARERLAASNAALDVFLAENVELLVAETGNRDIGALNDELVALAARQREIRDNLHRNSRAVQRGDWQAVSARLQDEALAALAARREAFRRQLARTPADSPSAADLERVIGELDARLRNGAEEAMADLRGELVGIEHRQGELSEALRGAVLEGNLASASLARLHELRHEAEIARSQHAALLERQRMLEAQAPIQVADARIVSPALVPGTPSFPDRGLILGVGALLALALGYGFALMRDLYLGGVATPAQLEAVLGLPVAATLPWQGGRGEAAGNPADAVVTAPHSPFSEAVRRLRAAVDRQLPARGPAGRVVMVSSARPGEGKSTVALALARANAQLGRRVILVDGDLRRPSLDRMLGVSPLYGLADYLADPGTEPEGDGFLVADPLSDVTVVVGRPWWEGPTDGLLLSASFVALMQHLRNIADLVIIDTPPLLGVVDAGILAAHCDAAVLVTRLARTAQGELRSSRRQLAEALGDGAPLLPVLNFAQGDVDYAAEGYYRL